MTRHFESDTLGRPDVDRDSEDPRRTRPPVPPAPPRPPRTLITRPVAIAAALLAAALLVTVVADDVAPLVVVVLGLAVAAWAARTGWRVAFATVLAGALVGEVLLAWAAPHIGWSFGSDTLLAWLLVGAAHLLLLARGPLPELGRRRLVDLLAVASGPLLVGGYLLIGARRGSSPWIGWGMLNDTANNVILNRELIAQGGLLRSQGNSAPLATVLYGSWGAQDAGHLGYAALVRQLIVSGEQLGLLVWATVGVATAVLALRSGPELPGRRILTGLAAGLLPWTWFGAGYAFDYGFENAGPAVLVLLLAWICWCEQRRHPVAALTGTVLATWAAATAWGPVAVIPAVLLVALVVVQRRPLRASRRLALVPALTFLAACGYAGLVTLRDVASGSGAFAYDGAAPVFSAGRTCAVVAVLVLVALGLWRRVDSHVRLGLVLVVAAGAVAVATLIRARAGLPEWWGYYPVKFTWIAMTATTLAAFAATVPLWERVADRLWRGTGLVVAAAVTLTMLFQMSPPPPTLTPTQVLAPVGMNDDRLLDGPAQELLGLIGQHRKSVVARIGGSGESVPAVESFMNFWMIEMAADSINDPIRIDAYGLNSGDPASICTTIANWDGGVVVWTRDPALRRDLADACPAGLAYDVRVLSGSATS